MRSLNFFDIIMHIRNMKFWELEQSYIIFHSWIKLIQLPCNLQLKIFDIKCFLLLI